MVKQAASFGAWWQRMSQAKLDRCGHITRELNSQYGLPKFDCGMFGCAYSSCDECYEGHLLEKHMFDMSDPRFGPGLIFRDSKTSYRQETIHRAAWAKRVMKWED
jgi:hypothetical protein